MSRIGWRVVRTEVLRGTAPAAGVSLVATGSVLLFNEATTWAGRWGPLAIEIRSALVVLVPVTVAAGVWQAGRQRRRHTGELIGSMARSTSQQVLVEWAAVTLGSSLGLFAAWLAAAVVVAPIATYPGRNWWLVLGVAFVALGTASAMGIAIGRTLPSRLAAPVAGLLTYGLIGVVSFNQGSRDAAGKWLAPSFEYFPSHGYLGAAFSILQAVWLAAVAMFLLALVGRSPWLMVAGAAVAMTTAVALMTSFADPWREDPAARELVCSDKHEQVCLARENAFLLGDAAPAIQDQLDRWDGVQGGFIRAEDRVSRDVHVAAPADGTAVIYVDELISRTGRVAESNFGASIHTVVARALDGVADYASCDLEADPSAAMAMNVAQRWAAGDHDPWWLDPAVGAEEHERLLDLPEADQKAWMGRFVAARQTCDQDAFTDLVGELR